MGFDHAAVLEFPERNRCQQNGLRLSFACYRDEVAEVCTVVSGACIPLRFSDSGIVMAELNQHSVAGAGLFRERIEQPFGDEGAGAPAASCCVVNWYNR